MNKEQISAEFDAFFEFPTSDKSQVSSVSCKLFAMIMVEMALSQSEPKCSCDGSGLVHTSDGTFLGHCDEHSAYRSEPSNKKWEPSQAMKDALAQSQKDGTLAFMCEGEPVFVSREGSPELHEYPECPMCHGSGCAGDNELVDSLELLYCQLTDSDSPNGLASSDDFKAWKEKHLLDKNKSEPVQVSQTACKAPVFYADKTTINGFMIDPYSRQSVIGMRIGEYANDTDMPLYLAPPDYEALKADNDNLKLRLGEWGRVYVRKNTEIESLKLRVAELESESRTKHEYAMQMLGERDRLQSECDRLRDAAKQALLALHYHTEQTRPIDTSFGAINALNAALMPAQKEPE